MAGWLAAVACGSTAPGQPNGETGGATGGGESAVTVGGAETESTGGSGSSSSTGTSGADGTFIVPPDSLSDSGNCDNWAQNCPPGYKCTVYADNGGNAWNNMKCVPVMEDPGAPGEPCFVVGSAVSGVDSCDVGVMCWDVNAENEGVCVALCTGTPRMPVCMSGFWCFITNEAVLNLCLEICDPLTQDCPGDEHCIAIPDDVPKCLLDPSSTEGLHGPCEFINGCDAGLACVDSSAAVECNLESSGCCVPYCDLTMMNTCPGMGQICRPFYPPGEAPAGQEDLGYCSVPG